MRMLRIIRSLAVVAASIGFLIPVDQLAAEGGVRVSARPRGLIIGDIALGEGGRLSGKIVGGNGEGLPGQVVVVTGQSNRRSHRTEADAEGRFTLRGVTGGVYHVSTDKAFLVCRCWATHTAPPAATNELLVVSDDAVNRGQKAIGDYLFCSPVLIGLIVAAAIAIPIAVHNSRSDGS